MSNALNRGLRLLEYLAERGSSISFSEINEALPDVGKASLSRLLKNLLKSGHLEKELENGHYVLGNRMARFASVKAKGREEYLISKHGSLMKDLARNYDLTVVLLEKVKNILVNIRKEQTPFSMNMQDVGNLNDNPKEPWLLTAAAFDSELREFYSKSQSSSELDRIHRAGYHFEDQTKRPQVRRLAFPLFDDSNELIGILGVGAHISQLNDENVTACVKRIMNNNNME